MTPRRLAVQALLHQEQAGYANLVLDAELKKCAPPLAARDAAFAARIFYTVLEYLPLLDYRLTRFSKKPLRALDAPVRAILRAGLARGIDIFRGWHYHERKAMWPLARAEFEGGRKQ